jgi:hypothetical protein
VSTGNNRSGSIWSCHGRIESRRDEAVLPGVLRSQPLKLRYVLSLFRMIVQSYEFHTLLTYLLDFAWNLRKDYTEYSPNTFSKAFPTRSVAFFIKWEESVNISFGKWWVIFEGRLQLIRVPVSVPQIVQPCGRQRSSVWSSCHSSSADHSTRELHPSTIITSIYSLNQGRSHLRNLR